MVTRVDYNGYYQLEDENGLPHSPDNDTPSFVAEDGTSCWYKHGIFHRELDLPAVVVDGGRSEYWVRGWRYRKVTNGPAFIPNDGVSPNEYWVWDIKTDSSGTPLPGYTPEDLPWYIAPDFLSELSDAELGNVTANPTPTVTPTITVTPEPSVTPTITPTPEVPPID